jgi:hypothetical protein
MGRLMSCGGTRANAIRRKHWLTFTVPPSAWGVIVALALPIGASSQTAARISDRPTCRGCRIEITPLVTLRTQGAEASVDRAPYSIALDSRGRIVLGVDGNSHFDVFDRSGVHVRSIGRQGRGPGEFVAARFVNVGSADSIFVFDHRGRRMSVFDPELRFVRSAPIPSVFSTAILSNGTVVVSGAVPDQLRAAKSFHLFDRVGNQIGSYGFPDAVLIPGEVGLTDNWVTAARGGGFWSASIGASYTIGRWSPNGELLARFDRESQLTSEGSAGSLGFTRDKPTAPFVRSIVEDSTGLLWVERTVADANWKRGVRFADIPGERGMVPEFVDYDRAYDTVLDVIDPRTRSLVWTQRFDEYFTLLTSPDKIARLVVQGDGTFRVAVQSLRLLGVR